MGTINKPGLSHFYSNKTNAMCFKSAKVQIALLLFVGAVTNERRFVFALAQLVLFG